MKPIIVESGDRETTAQTLLEAVEKILKTGNNVEIRRSRKEEALVLYSVSKKTELLMAL